METLYLRPASDFSVAQIPFESPDHFENVNKAVLDTDTYNYNNAIAWKLDLYGFAGHTAETGTIYSTILYAWIEGVEVWEYYNLAIRNGGSTVYQGVTQCWPAGNRLRSWDITAYINTWTAVDDLIAGVSLLSRIMQATNYMMWAAVQYSQSSGSDKFFMFF